MGARIAIRRAGPEDAAFLVACNQAMARETEGKALDAETLSRGVRSLLERPALGFYLVAEVAGGPAGCLMVTTEWSDWRNGLFWWVQSVYVEPARRRQGVYRALYAQVKALAREAGDVIGFRLYVERENLAAQRAYASLGMSETPYRMFEEPL